MKTSKYHILSSWILLICFIVGQYMVYAHQHHTTKGTVKIGVSSGKPSGQTVREKCSMCDAMHHTLMIAGESIHLSIAPTDVPAYTLFEYKFASIQIISAAGRAPPSSICLSMSYTNVS